MMMMMRLFSVVSPHYMYIGTCFCLFKRVLWLLLHLIIADGRDHGDDDAVFSGINPGSVYKYMLLSV